MIKRFDTTLETSDSQSSLLIVDNILSKTSKSVSKGAKPSCRRVHFDESRNTECPMERTEGSWYNKNDYETFRKQSMQTIQDFRENKSVASIFQRFIADLCDEDGKWDTSYCSEAVCQKKNRKLVQIYRSSMGLKLLGLENYAFAFIIESVIKRRSFLQEEVREIQHEVDYDYDDIHEVAEDLGECCRRISTPSLVFARALAQTQMIAQM